MSGETKIEQDVKGNILEEWPSFHEKRKSILSRVNSGIQLKERDVEAIFRYLAEDLSATRSNSLEHNRSMLITPLLIAG